MKTNKALLACLLFFVSCSSYGRKQPAASSGNGGFAVVELFTSEGCSSCPAAESVLQEVHNEYKQNVYVMEFHVDYWNYLGWKDIYSSSDFTERQQQYAREFHLNSTYTPQAIVNGKNELVGSDKGKLKDLIENDLGTKPLNTIQLSASESGGNITIAYTLTGNKNQELNITLVQKKAGTNVKRGENEGRKLQHINVVRALKTIDTAEQHGVMNIALPEGLTAAECSVIAYTQKKDNLEITGAAETNIVHQ